MLKTAAFLGIAAVALLFIVSLFLPGLPLTFGGTGGSGDAGEKFTDQGKEHIIFESEHEPYNSVPATSGPHYAQPLAPARWGIHGAPLTDEVLVHNLEHGGVGIQYHCPDGCDELVAQLSEIVDRGVEGGLKIVMSPFPDMDTRIALTAWNFLDKFDLFDEERIKTFIDDHESSSNAPEPTAR